MTDQLWRLAWALPVVIATGLLLIFWLKRMGVGQGTPKTHAEPIVRSCTQLTEHTQVLIVEIHQQSFIVFESSQHIMVQGEATHGGASARHPYLPGSAMALARQPGRRSS